MSVSERQLRLGGLETEARLRWFGHVKRRYSGYNGQRPMALPSRRKRGRTLKKFRTCFLKEDMQRVGVTEDDTSDWVKWRQKIRCGDS